MSLVKTKGCSTWTKSTGKSSLRTGRTEIAHCRTPTEKRQRVTETSEASWKRGKMETEWKKRKKPNMKKIK